MPPWLTPPAVPQTLQMPLRVRVVLRLRNLEHHPRDDLGNAYAPLQSSGLLRQLLSHMPPLFAPQDGQAYHVAGMDLQPAPGGRHYVYFLDRSCGGCASTTCDASVWPFGAGLTSRVVAAMQCLNLPSSRLLYRATAGAVTVLGARLALNFGLLYYTFFRGNGNTGFPVYRGATDEMIERLERFEWPLLRDGSLPTPDQQKAATRGNRGDGNEAGTTGSDEPDDSDSQARHMCVVRVAFLCLAASTACCACIAVDAGRGHTAADTRGCRCAICLAPFELGQPMVGLPCHLSHVFHAECCVPWLRRQRACPLCQRDIDMVPVPAGKRPSALDKVVCDALALKAASGEVAGASDAHAVIGQAPSLQGSAPTIMEETAAAIDVD